MSDSAQKKIRLVLADVDGTLVTKDKILTARAQEAVRRLHERAILFAITSGRPPLGMKMLIEPLKIETPVAGFNGGVFTHPDLTVISSRTIPGEAASRALEIIRRHKLTAWLYTAQDWFVPDAKGPHVDREAWTVKFPPKIEADFSDHLDRAVKIVGVSDDRGAMGKCEAECQNALRDRVSAKLSQPYYLDVTHPEANKGAVAEFLARHFKLNLAEIAVLGDMPNDVPMFERAGLSIAMGQSSKEVREKADAVTASNEDEGFSKAIEKYFLST